MGEDGKPTRYEIRIRGVLSERVLGAFPDLEAETQGTARELLRHGERRTRRAMSRFRLRGADATDRVVRDVSETSPTGKVPNNNRYIVK